jgi:hypothetical protein
MGFKGFLKSVVRVFRDGAVKVSHLFIDLFGKEKAARFADAAIGVLSTTLGNVIRHEVAKAEAVTPAQNGATKFAQVFAGTFAALPEVAKSAGTAVVESLIQLAVLELKGHFSPDTDGDGTPDVFDIDDDNDGVVDSEDAAPKDASQQ